MRMSNLCELCTISPTSVKMAIIVDFLYGLEALWKMKLISASNLFLYERSVREEKKKMPFGSKLLLKQTQLSPDWNKRELF